MEILNTLKDTPVPTLLLIGGFIFLFLGIATIKKPIVIEVTPSSRKIALILGIILIGIGLFLLIQPSAENPTAEATQTPEIVFNVRKEETNGCYVRFNGLHIDNNSQDSLSWDWGDGNFTKGFFPQEHTYTQSGSYSVVVTAPSGATKNFIIDVDCQSAILPTTTSQPISGNMLFSLKSAQPEDFYTLKDGTFLLLDNGNLAIAGGYGGGTYISLPMPKNFKASIQFSIENPEDEFIIGLSNGKEMRPNYHFVISSKGSSFKQQLGFDITDDWDKIIKGTNYKIMPNNMYEIVFERKNGGINILLNNIAVIGLGASDLENINSYDYFYMTGATHQQVTIMSLVVE